MMGIRTFIGLLVLGLVSFSHAASGQIKISDAYARATFSMATTGAVYLTLVNHADEVRKLTSVSVNKALADEAQIHTTQMVGEMVNMREVKEGVVLPPHQTVKLTPGGHHVMLLGLKQPLKEGEKMLLQLNFDDGSTKHVDVDVRKINGKDSTATQQSHSHH